MRLGGRPSVEPPPWTGCVLAVALASCARAAPAPEALRLVSFRQSDQKGVFLNETLVLDFDAELDRASVNAESVRVVRPDGRRARGHFEVTGKKVLFHPDVPRAADLADGGLEPASAYTVFVAGFPHPDGVRDRDGRPLARTSVATFETVDPRNVEGPVLEDRSPDRAAPLRLVTPEVGPFDAVELACDEPLDPRTLFAEDFVLRDDPDERTWLRAELVENGVGRARIALRAVDGLGNLTALPVGTHQLWVYPDQSRLRDFGGHPVPIAWRDEPRAGYVRVAEHDERLAAVDSRVEDFLDERRRSPANVEGVAGMASWRDGLVTIRFPAAAGDGCDGRVVPSEEESRWDVHATTLAIPAGREVRLTGDGLVVLRSQGRLSIDGELVRDVEGKQRRAAEDGKGRTWNDWAAEQDDWTTPPMTFPEGEPFTVWLERARARDESWTVLVAGGDLVINGRIWTDGPLLLVAGGWIRLVGDVLGRPAHVDDSGTRIVDPQVATLGAAGASEVALLLDAPRENPLAEAMTWAVLSAPIRPPARPARWRPAQVRGTPGAGGYRIGYLGERDGPGGTVEVVGPVDSPVLLERCDALRLRIELSMPPRSVSVTWDPPVVDSIEVAWEAVP